MPLAGLAALFGFCSELGAGERCLRRLMRSCFSRNLMRGRAPVLFTPSDLVPLFWELAFVSVY
jgi:hypothetical protein